MPTVYWFQHRTKCYCVIYLLLCYWTEIPLFDVLDHYRCEATASQATTTVRLLNNDTSYRSTKNAILEDRLNLAITDYINKFGPLPSGLKLPEETDDSTVLTSDSTVTATSSVSATQIQQRTSVGDFFTDLYYTILNPTLRCRLGLPSTCLCQEGDLRRAIVRAGTSFDNPTPITLCAGTIVLQDSDIRGNKNNNNKDFQPINITNKSFFIGCQAKERIILPKLRKKPTCVISGNGQQTIFYGNPIQLFLQNIHLINSYASTSAMNKNTTTNSNRRDVGDFPNTGMGGAIHLTGGKTFIDSVTFWNNAATIGGGAIYVGPTAQLTIASANFYNNHVSGSTASNTDGAQEQPQTETDKVIAGGALYIDGGVVIAAKGIYKENTVDVGYGGAVYAVEASIRLEDIEFEANVANRDGGAVAVNRSITQLASTTFEINTATNGKGNALFIGDDLDHDIDGSYVYCDPIFSVNFCYGFDDGTAIFEMPGGNHSNTNCQEVGLSDIFSDRCPNYIP